MNVWLLALLGGVLIGLSSAALLLFNGRIAGISGIVYSLVKRPDWSEWAWRLAFVVGLMGAGGMAMRLLGQSTASPAGTRTLLLAGLLVGFGTSMGSGCTSGHGVCGLGRLSRRSLVAVITFMTTAIITVFVMRHLSGGAA